MRYRLILPPRLEKLPLPKVIEKEDFEFVEGQLEELNHRGYNIYYFPNGSSKPLGYNINLSAKDVDKFEWVFIDMDLKDNVYKSKKQFVDIIRNFPIPPTKTIDSGHGVHVYWKISNLTRKSYLELQKALINEFQTDSSVWKIAQLMRKEGYNNTKYEPNVLAKIADSEGLNSGETYTYEQMIANLDPISSKDWKDIESHILKYIDGIKLVLQNTTIDPLPERFLQLLERRPQLSEWFYTPDDRSKCDIKIANVLQVGGFTEDEARIVLLQTLKGRERGLEYVEGIVRKVYDMPLDRLRDAGQYLEIETIASKFKLLEEIKLENYEYKLKEENKKVKAAKTEDSKRGIFSLKNTKESRKQQYKQANKKVDEGMKDILPCISPILSKVVPLYGVNVILVAAVSGNGKSTSAANLVVPIIKQNKRVIYFSTEERASDIMSRIVAVDKKWNFNNRRNWSESMRNQRDEAIDKLIDEDNILIVDSYTPSTDGKVILDITTKEGFETALLSIEKDKEKCDLLIIDYISKVSTSIKDSNLQEWIILDELTKRIEEWCKRMQVPAVIFTQLKPALTENQSFEDRIPGARRIFRYVTCAIEIKTDYDAKTSKWICHKYRDESNLFRKTLRYDKGNYIDYPEADDSVEVDYEENA